LTHRPAGCRALAPQDLAKTRVTLALVGTLGDAIDPVEVLGCAKESVLVPWDQLTDLTPAGRRFLRQRLTRQHVVLYVANDDATPLLNHVVLLTSCFRPACLQIFRASDRSLSAVGTRRRWLALWSLLVASATALVSLAQFIVVAHVRRRALRRETPDERGSARTLENQDVLYIKTIYSFSGSEISGAKAHTLGVVNAAAAVARKTVCLAVSPLEQADSRVRHVILPAPPNAPMLLSWYGLLLGRRLASTAVGVLPDGATVYQRLVPFCAPALILARRCKGTCTLEYNGSDAWVARHWRKAGALLGVLGYFERLALLAADRVVVVSDVLAAELRDLGVADSRIRMYPNGVDPRVCDSARYTAGDVARCRAANGIAANSTVVTFVGTFGKWHGAEVLADAIEEWARKDRAGLIRRRMVFVFAGDGLMLPEVKRRLSPETTRSFVRFPGMVTHDRILELLAASDILVSPHVPNADGSRFFGSPTKLFEYMSMARAIVASDLEQIGAILAPAARADRLHDSECARYEREAVAVLCRPASTEDIRLAIAFLADRPALRQRLGQNARDLVLAKYTWVHHVRAILGSTDRTQG
jgi:glycosyltransferase involved in cell wall biosynthesis